VPQQFADSYMKNHWSDSYNKEEFEHNVFLTSQRNATNDSSMQS